MSFQFDSCRTPRLAMSTHQTELEKELFHACITGDVDTVHKVIAAGVDPNKTISKGTLTTRETPLLTACRSGHLELVKYLIEVLRCSAGCTNFLKQTPLHYACWYGHLEIVKYLIEVQGCSTGCIDYSGKTPLHLACGYGKLKVVKYLIEVQRFSTGCTDNSGRTPLHEACEYGKLKIMKYLMEVQGCFARCTDNNGRTPLHEACEFDRLEIVKYLTEVQGCSTGCTDNSGQNPLHLACRYGKLKIVKYLMEVQRCSARCTDNRGRTPLHIACMTSWSNKKTVAALIAYLLEHGHCDPNSATHDGKTPLDIAREPDHIRLLLKFGATPTKVLINNYFPQQLQEEPADMSIKMFILGNSGVGKSTLVKSLKTEGDGILVRFRHRLSKVTDVDERTTGIIPYDIESKALGRVTLYDFAGHREFYAGHDALLQNSMTTSPSIIVLVIDMRAGKGHIRETLQYWFEFINNHSTEGRSESHLVVVGSHVDTLSSSDMRLNLRSLRSITKHHNLDNISIAGKVMLDCRYAESSSMSRLRSVLSCSCRVLRNIETMAITHRSFLIFLFDKFRDEPAVKLDIARQEMICCADTERYMYLNCVLSSNLIEVCEMLNKRGDILFMKNSQQPEISWIVFNKVVLLSRVNGVIFAPEGFKEHQGISTCTGVVPLSKLAALFPSLDHHMICQFLCHLEFCHEMTDPEILTLLHAKADCSPSDEKFLYFPGLVDLNVPPNVWQPNSQFGYHSGWLLQCNKHGQFLTPRFLQVLLLRLAYSLAFVTSEKKSVLERNCYVWKCGICWSDTSGLEIFVEVVNQKSVIVLTRSLKQIESQTRLTFVRSRIIKIVLDTKKELCPKVTVEESFLHPQDTVSYPLDFSNVKIVTMKQAAQAIVVGKLGVLDNDNQMVDLMGGLLCYEPYLGFKQSILNELFMEDDLAPIEDGFLFEIAKCMYKNTDYIIELFKTCPIRLANLMDRAPPGDVHRLVRVFQLWREEMGAEATQYNLRKQLDQFSIFAGRNPLILCVW